MGNCLCFKKRKSEEIYTVDHKELKLAGNEFYKQGKYDEAINEYSKAIKVEPNISIYYSNRALCFYKLRDYKNAYFDGNFALKLDKNNFKGLVICVKSKASQALEGDIEHFYHSLEYCKQFKLFFEKISEADKMYCNHLKKKIKSLFNYIDKKQKKRNLTLYYSDILPNELLAKIKHFIEPANISIESLNCPLTIVKII